VRADSSYGEWADSASQEGASSRLSAAQKETNGYRAEMGVQRGVKQKKLDEKGGKGDSVRRKRKLTNPE